MSRSVRLYVLNLCIVRCKSWCDGAGLKKTEWGGGTAGAERATGEGNDGEDVGCKAEKGRSIFFSVLGVASFSSWFVVGQPGGLMVGGELVCGKVNVVGGRRWRSGCTSCSMILFLN